MSEGIDAQGPLVSIGLPVFNGADYLEEAVTSLQAQTYQNIEIIISDNHSDDETPAIAQALCDQDPRVRLSRTDHNIGAARNFNRVVDLARGDVFMWANHDDLWAPTYVERCLEALQKNPSCVLAYAQSHTIDEHGDTTCVLNSDLGLDAVEGPERLRKYHDYFIDLDRRRAWNDQEPIEGLWIPVYGLMRTELLKRTSRIGNYIGSDTILLEQLLLLGPFLEIDESLFFKRDHPGRSMRAAIPYAKRSEWFTGRAATTFIFPRWRTLYERLYWSVVLPARLSTKLKCLGEMLAFYVRRTSERNALIKEIIINLSQPFVLRSERKFFERW